jgi:hypothetical protein
MARHQASSRAEEGCDRQVSCSYIVLGCGAPPRRTMLNVWPRTDFLGRLRSLLAESRCPQNAQLRQPVPDVSRKEADPRSTKGELEPGHVANEDW